MKSDLDTIPGIGKTFSTDFARINIHAIKDLRGKNPERLFKKLEQTNAKVGHKTSKNYLYVLRMAVYVANGGTESKKMKWATWKDA